jgi:hypothetical protein
MAKKVKITKAESKIILNFTFSEITGLWDEGWIDAKDKKELETKEKILNSLADKMRDVYNA